MRSMTDYERAMAEAKARDDERMRPFHELHDAVRELGRVILGGPPLVYVVRFARAYPLAAALARPLLILLICAHIALTIWYR